MVGLAEENVKETLDSREAADRLIGVNHLQIPRNGCVVHRPDGLPTGVFTAPTKHALLNPQILVRIPPGHVGVVWIDGLPHSSWMHPAELTTA